MKRISTLIGLLGLVVLFGFGCSRSVTPTVEQTPVIDRSAILIDAKNQGLIMDTGEIEHMKDPAILKLDEKKDAAPAWASMSGIDYKTWRAAALADVTSGTSYGLAYFKFIEGKFKVAASFGGLPQTTDGSSYEVWLVKRGDGMSVLSLGKVTWEEKLMTFTYASKADLSEYDFFVVTLQAPNAVAPGEHLLEGVIR